MAADIARILSRLHQEVPFASLSLELSCFCMLWQSLLMACLFLLPISNPWFLLYFQVSLLMVSPFPPSFYQPPHVSTQLCPIVHSHKAYFPFTITLHKHPPITTWHLLPSVTPTFTPLPSCPPLCKPWVPMTPSLALFLSFSILPTPQSIPFRCPSILLPHPLQYCISSCNITSYRAVVRSQKKAKLFERMHERLLSACTNATSNKILWYNSHKILGKVLTALRWWVVTHYRTWPTPLPH